MNFLLYAKFEERRRWLILISYAALLLVASILPDTRQTGDPFQNLLTFISPTLQNALHIPAYGLLAWLICEAANRRGSSPNLSMIAGMATAMSYGMLMEVIQIWVPGRYPSAMDIAFNALGAGIGSWIWKKSARHRSLPRVITTPSIPHSRQPPP